MGKFTEKQGTKSPEKLSDILNFAQMERKFTVFGLFRPHAPYLPLPSTWTHISVCQHSSTPGVLMLDNQIKIPLYN